MYFCPNCSYIFDIQKSSNSTKVDDRLIINKLADAFKLYDDNKNLSKYKANFQKEELNKNKRYQKLSDVEKIKFNVIFEELVASGAEFKCNNCNYIKQISESTLLYEINFNDNKTDIRTLEENELTTKDPLLPHTHDYTCKNPSCITHKNNTLKDSVFFRDKNSYKLNYICCVCFYNW